MKLKHLLIPLLLADQSKATSIIVDSFLLGATETDTDLNQPSVPTVDLDSAVAGKRILVRSLQDEAIPGTSFLRTQVDITGQGEFRVQSRGPKSPNTARPLFAQLSYITPAEMDFSSFQGFDLEFSDIIGSGTVFGHLGNSPLSTSEDERIRIELAEAGVIHIPLESFARGIRATDENVVIYSFIFQPIDDQDFSFVLDEINLVVPEPSSILLSSMALALATFRRRRA